MKRTVRIFKATQLLLVLMSVTASQIFAQTDRRQSQLQGAMGQSSELNLGGALGSFYFMDQLGLTLGMSAFPVNHAINPDTYILGPGDLVAITLEGDTNGSFRGLMVTPQGEVIIPNVGMFKVDGLHLSQAEEEITSLIEDNFRNTKARILVERPRMVQVHIAGEVPFPGSQLVPSQTRLDQAIYPSLFSMGPDQIRLAAGANNIIPPAVYPTGFVTGSDYNLRNIEILHLDGSRTVADLVAYFRAGDLENNPPVRFGDVIQVSKKQIYGNKISISGAVKKPAQLDFKEGDSVANLINIGGGFTDDAVTAEVTVYRRNGSTIDTFTVSPDDTTPLEPNDRVVVDFDRSIRTHQAAWVHGQAVSPGNYPIEKGVTTVYDLLSLAGGLTDDALPHAAYLIRKQPNHRLFDGTSPDLPPVDRVALGDSLGISVPSGVMPRYFESRSTLDLPSFDPKRIFRTSDQFKEGYEYLNLESTLNRNQIYLDLSDEEQLKRIVVFNSDEIFIPKDDNLVFLLGQINRPGYYTFESGMGAYDYVAKAGGYSLAADDERVFVIKAGTNSWYLPSETTVQSGDIIFVDRQPLDDLTSARMHEIQRAQIRNTNIQLVVGSITALSSLITAYIALTR